MLRIVPSMSAEGAKRYFDDALSRGDYYLDGQELAGSWGGAAAERLGLSGEVSREAFHQLCDNINPGTGKRLTARTRSNRRVGYDFNFHCPKTVSVVYTLTGDERIMEAFRASARETMQELERDCECRVRDGGQNGSRVTGNMLWGEFIHMTARPVDGVPDAHLHAHYFSFNATWDHEQERWKASDFGNIKRDGRYFEAAFHARFSGRMREMGYGIRRDGKGFWDIAGIPESVKEKFSRRKDEIEEMARELGLVDADAIAELGARTRQAKTKGTGMDQLREEWDGRLTHEEREAIHGAADGGSEGDRVAVDAAIDHGIRHLFERRSAVSDRELVEAGLRRGFGSVSLEDAWEETAARQRAGSVLSGEVEGRRMVTTPHVLAEERAMIDFARDGRGACEPLLAGEYEFRDPLFSDPSKDTEEQERAILAVFGSHDRVVAVRGAAGAGKTTLMREVVAGIQEEGRSVFAFAPTAEASRGVLRDEGFEEADTVARLLQDREMQARLRGQVMWIDEAGLLGASALARNGPSVLCRSEPLQDQGLGHCLAWTHHPRRRRVPFSVPHVLHPRSSTP